MLIFGSGGCILTALPVLFLCPRGGGCGPGFFPLL